MKNRTYSGFSVVLLSFLLVNGNVYAQSLFQEASQKARAFWATKLSKCGDSYYGKILNTDSAEELKGVSIQVAQYSVSRVERLNGVQFKGSIRLKLDIQRVYSVSEGKWYPWSTPMELGSTYANDITKNNGKWSIDDGSYQISSGVSAVGCEFARNPSGYRDSVKAGALNAADKEMLVNLPHYGIVASKDPAPPIEMLRELYRHKKNGNQFEYIELGSGKSWAASEGSSIVSSGLPGNLTARFEDGGRDIDLIRVFNNGKMWFMSNGGRRKKFVWSAPNFPSLLGQYLETVRGFQNQGLFLRLLSLDVRDDANWVFVYTNDISAQTPPIYSCQCAQEIKVALDALISKGSHIKQFAYFPGKGWLILYDTNSFQYYDIPQALVDSLQALHNGGSAIDQVAIGPDLSWIIYSRYCCVQMN